MPTFFARLKKLETSAHPPSRRKMVSWALQGPVDLTETAAVALLRECGHDVRDEDFNPSESSSALKMGGPWIFH